MNLYQSNTYRKDFKASYISVMNQGFKRGSKWRIHSPENSFSQLIQQFQVVTRGTRPGVITVFHTQPYGRFIEIPSSLRRKKHTTNQCSNFFLEAVLPVEIRPILAIYCRQLSHAFTCPFSKFSQICTFLPRLSNILPFF